jgi:hypothetical protein
MASSWKSLPVAFGVVALYLLVAVEVTSLRASKVAQTDLARRASLELRGVSRILGSLPHRRERSAPLRHGDHRYPGGVSRCARSRTRWRSSSRLIASVIWWSKPACIRDQGHAPDDQLGRVLGGTRAYGSLEARPQWSCSPAGRAVTRPSEARAPAATLFVSDVRIVLSAGGAGSGR